MEARTKGFVEHRWWAIAAVAEALLQRTTLNGAAVGEVIGDTLNQLIAEQTRRRDDGPAQFPHNRGQN